MKRIYMMSEDKRISLISYLLNPVNLFRKMKDEPQYNIDYSTPAYKEPEPPPSWDDAIKQIEETR